MYFLLTVPVIYVTWSHLEHSLQEASTPAFRGRRMWIS
jgi:hypothetical protein